MCGGFINNLPFRENSGRLKLGILDDSKANMTAVARKGVDIFPSELSNAKGILSPILSLTNPIPGPIREVFSDVVSYWSSVLPA